MKKNFDVDNFVNKLKTNCRLCETKEFQANEVITTFLTKRNQFCILLEGEAQLITYDKDGNKKFFIIIKRMIFLVKLYSKYIWIESCLF